MCVCSLTECEKTPLAFVKAILSLSRIISGHIMWSTPADLVWSSSFSVFFTVSGFWKEQVLFYLAYTHSRFGRIGHNSERKVLIETPRMCEMSTCGVRVSCCAG